MTRIQWSYTVETSPLLHYLTLLAIGAIGSIFVLAGAGAVFVVGASLVAGQVAVLAAIALFAMLFARRFALHVELARREPGLREYFSGTELVAACVAWAAVVVAAFRYGGSSRLVYGCIVAVAFVCLPLVAALRSEGYVDTDAGTFTVNDTETSLTAVDAVSRYDIGRLSLLRVHYHDAAGGSAAPRLFGVPTDDAAHIRATLESSDGEPPDTDSNPLVARTLYAFGLGAFAVAVAFAYVGLRQGGDAAVVGTYGAAFAALFGVLFVWLGYVEN